MSEKIDEKEENKQIEEKKVKVFYFKHTDGLERLSPILIIDGKKIYQTAVKRKIIGKQMYYIFSDNKSYVKLWKDSKNNLLFYVDNYYGSLFYSEEPQIWKFSLSYCELQLDDNSLTFNNKKLNFNIPIFNFIRNFDEELIIPTAYILLALFYEKS